MSKALARWGGLAGVAGGVLFATWGYVHRDGAPAYFAAISDTLALAVPLLFLATLMGLYARHRTATGWLGRLGIVLGSAGCARGIFDAAAGDPSRHLYAAGFGWAAPLLEWLFLVLLGLGLLGVAFLNTASRGLGLLLLVIGFFGFAYNLTDSGGLLEARVAHTVYGTLFSAAWAVLGVYLCLQNRHHDTKPSDGAPPRRRG